MSSKKKKNDIRYRYKLPVYIMLSGWLSLVIYILISMESTGADQLIEHFLSGDRGGFRFRALILFAPFISTIAGYMAAERERFTKDLEKANKELEEHLREKDDFITRLGHDIKTPLTPLINLLPLVRKKISEESAGKLLDVTIQNVNTLKNLVVKTLKHARASREYSTSEMQDIPARDIVESCLLYHEHGINEKSLIVKNDVSDNSMVKCIRSEIEELLGNVISNAVKFSHDEGSLIIESFEEKGTTTISIRDFGHGLTEEQEEIIFAPFYKADESRHELDSSGLGLSISRKIAENHGGRIWAESPGQWLGTKISFTLTTGMQAPKEDNGT
jgi:signal transduction histidine kinase